MKNRLDSEKPEDVDATMLSGTRLGMCQTEYQKLHKELKMFNKGQ